MGCVAIAMGMIMHYWKYPSVGWGSQSYNISGTTLSANFGDTAYDWEHMPDSLTNGYFALGHLNPIGYDFNKNNTAIFDIFPQYDPYVVTASAHPASAGHIE